MRTCNYLLGTGVSIQIQASQRAEFIRGPSIIKCGFVIKVLLEKVLINFAFLAKSVKP